MIEAKDLKPGARVALHGPGKAKSHTFTLEDVGIRRELCWNLYEHSPSNGKMWLRFEPTDWPNASITLDEDTAK